MSSIGPADHGNAEQEPHCSDSTRQDAAESRSEVNVKVEPMDEQGEDDVKVKIKNEPKDGVPVRLKRKGRRGRSSGTLTMKGDKITSFTTERGVTYAPNGLFCYTCHGCSKIIVGQCHEIKGQFQ